MNDLLAGIDDVPWGDLEHAYGSATDTPALLQRVARGDVDVDTWDEVFGSLAHQTMVYAASAAAAPYLIRLTYTLHGDDLQGVLALLDAIASGNGPDEQTSLACVRAAEQGFERYVELLEHESPGVRTRAAQLVAAFPERAAAVHERVETALDRATDPATRVALVQTYLASASQAAPEFHERLRGLARAEQPSVAAAAALGLLKRGAAPQREWLSAIARELTRSTNDDGADVLEMREVLREMPEACRPALFDALIEHAPAAVGRFEAFQVGHALLWLAFRHRLGGPARKPRPFVFVESLAFAMPRDTGGGKPDTMEAYPSELHWRAPSDRACGVEWICSPYVRRWDFPRPGYWTEPVSNGQMPGVNIAEPVEPNSLNPRESQALQLLARWDAFWQTDSDLPMIYGVPPMRRDLVALVENAQPSPRGDSHRAF
jgi:hypothetical protein